MHILFTRSLDDSKDLILKFNDLGHKVSYMPVIEIQGIGYEKVNFKDYKALIFTSANSLKFLNTKEIDKNDIIYIFPHQLKFLRENYFDLSIMIGIINETEPKTLMNYMHYVNKISRNLYMKVFKYSGLPFSFYNF